MGSGSHNDELVIVIRDMPAGSSLFTTTLTYFFLRLSIGRLRRAALITSARAHDGGHRRHC